MNSDEEKTEKIYPNPEEILELHGLKEHIKSEEAVEPSGVEDDDPKGDRSKKIHSETSGGFQDDEDADGKNMNYWIDSHTENLDADDSEVDRSKKVHSETSYAFQDDAGVDDRSMNYWIGSHTENFDADGSEDDRSKKVHSETSYSFHGDADVDDESMNYWIDSHTEELDAGDSEVDRSRQTHSETFGGFQDDEDVEDKSMNYWIDSHTEDLDTDDSEVDSSKKVHSETFGSLHGGEDVDDESMNYWMDSLTENLDIDDSEVDRSRQAHSEIFLSFQDDEDEDDESMNPSTNWHHIIPRTENSDEDASECSKNERNDDGAAGSDSKDDKKGVDKNKNGFLHQTTLQESGSRDNEFAVGDTNSTFVKDEEPTFIFSVRQRNSPEDRNKSGDTSLFVNSSVCTSETNGKSFIHYELSNMSQIESLLKELERSKPGGWKSQCNFCIMFLILILLTILLFRSFAVPLGTYDGKLGHLKTQCEAIKLRNEKEIKEMEKAVVEVESKLEKELARQKHLKIKIQKIREKVKEEEKCFIPAPEGLEHELDKEERTLLSDVVMLREKMKRMETDAMRSEKLSMEINHIQKSIIEESENLHKMIFESEENTRKKYQKLRSHMYAKLNEILAEVEKLTEAELPLIVKNKHEEILIQKTTLDRILKATAELLEETQSLSNEEQIANARLNAKKELRDHAISDVQKKDWVVRKKLEELDSIEKNVPEMTESIKGVQSSSVEVDTRMTTGSIGTVAVKADATISEGIEK